MNSIQTNYINAKAAADIASAAFDAYSDSIEHLFDDTAAWDAAMEQAPDYLTHLNALISAEDALIEWSLNEARKVAFLDQLSALSYLSQHTTKLAVRKQILDAALRLES